MPARSSVLSDPSCLPVFRLITNSTFFGCSTRRSAGLAPFRILALHPCRSFESDRQFLTTFAANVSFEKNCQLNEYLKRTASTSDGFELVLQELRQIERQTGRPFVLLVYGDHQPWSFTTMLAAGL